MLLLLMRESMAFWDVRLRTLLAGCQLVWEILLLLSTGYKASICQNTQQHMSEISNQVHFSASVCILLALVVNLFTTVSLLLAP
jgi:hypothetical protein